MWQNTDRNRLRSVFCHKFSTLHNQHITHHRFVWQTTDRNRLRSVFCHKFSGFLHFATTHHTNLQKGTCKPGFLWQNTDHTRGNRKPGFVWQNTDCNRLCSVFCHKFSTLLQRTHHTSQFCVANHRSQPVAFCILPQILYPCTTNTSDEPTSPDLAGKTFGKRSFLVNLAAAAAGRDTHPGKGPRDKDLRSMMNE